MQLTLTQAWFPQYTYTYNGLAWYLSVTLFLYAISFPLVKVICNIKKPIMWILVLWVSIGGLNIYFILYGGINLYSNPIYRLSDYILGMLTARTFQKKDYIEVRKANKIEIGVLLAFIIQYIFSFKLIDAPGYYSILFTVALYIFAVGEGHMSSILSWPGFNKLANYSFEFYMIHELALRVFRNVFPEATHFSKITYVIRNLKISICAILITIILAILYKNIRLRKQSGIRKNIG